MRRNRRMGFTVIELVMVVAVIGVLAVVFFSQLSSYFNIKASSAAHKIVSDIRYSQQLAIQRHEVSGLILDSANNSYYVYVANTSTRAVDPFLKENLEVDFDTDANFQGVDLVGTNFGPQLEFDVFGVPSISSQGTITISFSGNTYVIYVEPETGRVRLQ